MPHQDAQRERLRDRVVETSLALYQAAQQGHDTHEAKGAHADAVRALLAWENRPAVPLQAQVQQLVDRLAQDLDLHIGHPGLERAYSREMLKNARAVVLAINSATDPHLAAVQARTALRRTGIHPDGGPPNGGGDRYLAQVDAIIEATAPAPPHPFQMLTVPVHVYPVAGRKRTWEAAVCVGGRWYTRRCERPEDVEELGPVVKHGAKPTSALWTERDFTPDDRDVVLAVPVEFPLVVTPSAPDWNGWRAWVPAPAQADQEAAPQPEPKALT